MEFISHYFKSLTPFGKPTKPKPISWNLAVEMAEKKMLPLINRRKLCKEEDYKQSKKEIAKHWDSVESHIKHYVFGMPYKLLQLDDELNLVRTVQEPLEGMLKKKYIM